MAENTFEPQEINLQIQPMPVFIDADGSFKLNTPMLSSFDFDGSIPKFEGEIDAIEVNPGYLIQVESGGEYFSVVSVEADEPDIDNTGIVTINYLDDQGDVVSVDYGETDSVSVIYEDWSDKSVGSQGWGITAGGNAIFTNVAVRGDLEATTLNVGGEDGITYDGSEVIIGASVTILGGITIGDVENYLDENEYTTEDDLDGFITGPEVNTNVTSISGGVITSGRIKSSGYNGPDSGGGSFSTTGSQLNLDDGTFVSPAVRVNSDGDGFFQGSLETSNIRIDAPTSSNLGYIVGGEQTPFSGLLSNIAFNFYSGYTTFSHNGKSWTIDNTISQTSLLRDQLYAYPGSNPFRSLILRSGYLTDNSTGNIETGAYLDLRTNSNSTSAILSAENIQIAGQINGNLNYSWYLGTSLINLNRSSGAITLNGVSINGNAGTATSATSATKLNGEKIARGTGTVSLSNQNNGTTNVSFGITFSSTPTVVATSFGDQRYYAFVNGATTTGATIGVAHRDGTNRTDNIAVRWIAVGTVA